MINPNDANIPEEILASETKRATPTLASRPGTLGLPGLPPEILNLAVQYGPYLVLAAAVMGGFQAVSSLIWLSNTDTSTNGVSPLGVFLTLGASITMGLAYIWLVQKRRIGWNTLALGLIIQFLGQILATGVSTILYIGFELLLIAYIMLQLRDSYTS